MNKPAQEVVESTENEITIQPAASITPMQMLQIAVEQNADIDKMEKLMALSERWEANEAKKAFVVAMTAFKGENIEILKDKTVSFTGRDNNTTSYKHASLDGAVKAAIPHMSRHGLSHKWDMQQSDDGGRITVTCVITHQQGYSESTSLSASPDDSGKKNSIQQIASTVSYLERYTFLAITGLTTTDMNDDDGAAADPIDTIIEKQALDLEAKITETDASKAALLRYYKIDQLEDLPASDFNGAIKALEDRQKQAKK